MKNNITITLLALIMSASSLSAVDYVVHNTILPYLNPVTVTITQNDAIMAGPVAVPSQGTVTLSVPQAGTYILTAVAHYENMGMDQTTLEEGGQAGDVTEERTIYIPGDGSGTATLSPELVNNLNIPEFSISSTPDAPAADDEIKINAAQEESFLVRMPIPENTNQF